MNYTCITKKKNKWKKITDHKIMISNFPFGKIDKFFQIFDRKKNKNKLFSFPKSIQGENQV